MMNHEDVYDVTIIGGGPAGLFAAFYSGLSEMKTKVIEYQQTLGGKVHVYPEKMIWDIGGLTPVLGETLIEQMVGQGLTFHPTVVLGRKVEAIERGDDNLFVLHTDSGERHVTRTVILAIGGGILEPQRIDLEGAEKFEVSNLSYTVKSLARFKDKTVIISGGGNTAVDWANELEPIARQVYVTYRKDTLSGHEAQVKQLLDSSARCFFHTTITRLIAAPDHAKIDRVELTNHETGQVQELPVDEVIINHGFERDRSLLDNSKIKLELADGFFVAGRATGATSVPGVYAAGDILKYDGKLHLIAGAFQDAANAVNQAKRHIQPDAREGGTVSSHNDIFQSRNRELIRKLLT